MPENRKLAHRRRSTPSRVTPPAPMTRAELAARVVDYIHATTGDVPGIDANYIGRLERGEVTWPGQRYREALRHILKATDDDLGFHSTNAERYALTHGPTATLTVTDPDRDHHPWSLEGAVSAVNAVAHLEDAVHRRTFIALGGATLAAVAQDWLIAPPAGSLAHEVAGRRVTAADAEALEVINGDLRRLDDRYGGGAIFTQARAQVAHVADILDTARYTDRVGRHLHSAAAELLRVTGWMAFSANRHGDADRYWTAALHAAHVAADTATARNTLGFMSCMAKDTGAGNDAVRIIDAALEHATPHPRLGAVLACRAAQAHAQIGDRNMTVAYIDQAEAALGDSTSSGPDAVSWMDADYLHSMAGFAFLRLGDWPAAIERLRFGLTGDADRGLRVELLALLAQAHARHGDTAEAVTVAGQAVDLLADDVRYPRVVNQLRTVALVVGERDPELGARVQALAS